MSRFLVFSADVFFLQAEDGIRDVAVTGVQTCALPIPELRDWFIERNNGEDLIHKGASSRKLKMQTKMVQIVKASLKEHDTKAYNMFIGAMESATGVTTQKRFYMSEYGYSNTKEVLLGNTNTLIKADNYDRYEIEKIGRASCRERV